MIDRSPSTDSQGRVEKRAKVDETKLSYRKTNRLLKFLGRDRCHWFLHSDCANTCLLWKDDIRAVFENIWGNASGASRIELLPVQASLHPVYRLEGMASAD